MKPGEKIDAALATIAGAFPGEITGTLVDVNGELEVEVTLRVTRRISSANAGRIRARAMLLLAAEPWRDNCPATVKNRGPWAISKHKGCSNKVSAVVVYSSHADMAGPLRPDEYRRMLPSESYHFMCSHHAEAVTGPDVIAVVRLEQVALRTLRTRLKAESDARAAAERVKERELEDELRTVSDGDLARRLAEFRAANAWGAEDACKREQWRRERERNTKPADRPVSTGGNS